MVQIPPERIAMIKEKERKQDGNSEPPESAAKYEKNIWKIVRKEESHEVPYFPDLRSPF